MKYLNIRFQPLSIFALSFLLLFPFGLYAQKGPDKDNITIVVSCTEYIGDGKIKANFAGASDDIFSLMVSMPSTLQDRSIRV